MGGHNFDSKQSDRKFYDLYQTLVGRVGGYLEAAKVLKENPRTFQQRKCGTDKTHILGATQHLFRLMDYALKVGMEEPVFALVDYINQRYGRSPSLSAEEGDVQRSYLDALIELRGVQQAVEKALVKMESNAMLQSVFDVVPYHLFLKDRESRYLMVNKAMATYYGLAPKDFQGVHILEAPIGTPEQRQRFLETDRAAMAGRRTVVSEFPVTRNNKSQLHSWVKMPLRDKEGSIIGVVGMVEEITDRKKPG